MDKKKVSPQADVGKLSAIATARTDTAARQAKRGSASPSGEVATSKVPTKAEVKQVAKTGSPQQKSDMITNLMRFRMMGMLGDGEGGLGGLLVGGLVGGLSASKEYEAYEKTRKENEKIEKEQRAAASSEMRRNLGRQQSDVSDAYLSATPNVEMVDTTGGGISSYDAYKRRMFGG